MLYRTQAQELTAANLVVGNSTSYANDASTVDNGSWTVPASTTDAQTQAAIAALGANDSIAGTAAQEAAVGAINKALDPNWVYSLPPVPTAATLGGPSGALMTPTTAYRKEPVDTATGSYYTTATDLRLAGIGVPFSFTRSYNSADSTTGRLGQGWVDSFGWSATTNGNGDVDIRAGSGQTIHFTKQTDGTFLAPPGGRATLATSGSGYELVTTHDQLHYLFDAQGRLTAQHDRNGQGLTMAYDVSGNLLTITDSAGRVIQVTITGGLLQKVTLPDGRYVQYSYTGGLLTSVRDARGGTTTYSYDASAGNRLKTIVDQNQHTLVTNSYDPTSGRVIEQDDARGNKSYFSWNAATQTSTLTDARGKLWKDIYSNNVLLQQLDPLNNSTSYDYDGNLNVDAVTDPRGHTTTMGYDSRGNLLTRNPPAPFTFTESWTYDSLNDVKTHTDGRNNTTTYVYDTAGNLTTIIGADPDGPGPLTSPATTITRDPAGTGLATAIQDPRGKTTQYGYDSQHNLTSVTTQLLEKTTMGYDSSGRMTSRVDPRGNAQGADPNAYTWHYTYNEFDQLHTQTDPLGHLSTIDYYPDGSLQTKTDANGHATSYSYWPSNQLKTVTAPDPDGAGPLTAPVTSYAYDPAGNLTSRTDANTHTTSYSYDDADRLASTQTQLGNLTTYGYDADGNLTSTVDANGNATQTAGDGTTTYGYDNLNRLSSVSYSDAPTTPNLSFTYDENGNRKTMIDGATGTVNYSYDNLNELTSVSRGSNTFSYGYDPAGNISQRTYPDTTVASYAYDDDERLLSLANTSVGTTSYSYDAAGNLQTTTLPAGNGYVESRTYDNAGRLTETKDVKGGSTLADFTQTLDPVGNPQTLTRTGSIATTQVYGYDNLDRLTSVCYQTSCPTNTNKIAWTYDPVGNRLSETRATTSTAYSYDGDDRLTQTSASPGPSLYFGQVQTDGAQPYWRLGEPLGTTTFASSVGSYTGTWGTGTAKPTLGTPGALNGDTNTAATFTATNSQYGNVSNAAGLNKTNNFSLELWLKRTTLGTLQAVAGKPLTTTTKSENYAIWLTAANKPQFEVGAGTGNKSAVILSSTAITDTTSWHHIVGTFASGVLKIYLDGSLTGTNSNAGFTTVTTNTSTFDIGRSGTNNYFSGSLDELALYSTPLTATQITDHYNKGHNPPAPTITPSGYDNDGRQTTAGTNTYTYNLADQLTAATVNGTPTTYGYDGDNNRLTTASAGTTTNQLWDTNYGLPQLALERDSSNNLLRRYLIGTDVNSLTTPVGNFFYHRDPLGSISNITDSTGVTQWTYAYEPNGLPSGQTVKNSPTAPSNPLQYTGQYQDPTSNLYNLRARQYDATTGRFLARDPDAARIGSTYAYVEDRPTALVDPSGAHSRLSSLVTIPYEFVDASFWYGAAIGIPAFCATTDLISGGLAVAATLPACVAPILAGAWAGWQESTDLGANLYDLTHSGQSSK